jgi:capsular exopolysaccharide synthesis family protein
MSRVFEALRNIPEKAQGTGAKTLGPEWGRRDEPIREGPTPVLTDSIASSRIEFPYLEAWPLSWREKIEGFLSGWNLRRRKKYPIVALEKGSPAAEQYKILREQVMKGQAESGARCVSVTSPVKGDGKTSVAVNLAAAIALRYEEQVLLIDGDLRSPEIHRYFGIQPTPGLAEYLSSSSNGDVMSYVQDTFLPSLRILPAGNRSDVSSELLAKEKMKNLLHEIRSRFPGYQIIIDTPPVLSTPDPLVLAKQMEGIIMVIRAGKTPRDYLFKALRSLNSGKLIGIVLNHVDVGMASKYYYGSQ